VRRACGCALANAGHDTRRIQSWLGHKGIQHTVRHTELNARPFKEFWRLGNVQSAQISAAADDTR